MTELIHLLATFGISMLPLVELRGAIPYGFAFGLPWWQVMGVSVVGNLLPAPLIILFIRKIFAWLKDKGRFGSLIYRLEKKAERGANKVLSHRMMWFGLFLLVAVPLPGTGAWTGALVAAVMDMRLKKAMPAIALGVVVAAFAVSAMTYGAAAIFG